MTTIQDTMYLHVARVLRTGFRIAAILLLLGVGIALVRQEPLETKVDPFADIPGKLFALHAAAFIDLAIIAIVLSPVAAVIAIWLGFKREGETRFATYTLGVIAILTASIALSLFS